MTHCEYCGDPIPSGSQCDDCREHWAMVTDLTRHLNMVASIETSVRERAQLKGQPKPSKGKP